MTWMIGVCCWISLGFVLGATWAGRCRVEFEDSGPEHDCEITPHEDKASHDIRSAPGELQGGASKSWGKVTRDWEPGAGRECVADFTEND